MAHTVGSFLFEYLREQGIEHAFGIPGDFALPTFHWLEESDIELVTMTHEPAVGFAADAYARSTGGLGLAVVTYCVGGLNMVNSIACAYAEKSPVVVVAGGPSVTDKADDRLLVHHKVKTFDTQRRIYEEVTCATTVLNSPSTAAAEIARVVQAARRECRPVYIEVPCDVVNHQMPENSSVPTPTDPKSDPASLEVCLREAVEFINNSDRPVVVCGVELHRHGLADVALGIAERFGIPIASTLLSKSIVDGAHPLYIGSYSGTLSEPACGEYVDGSDCVIMLGTFITDVFLGGSMHLNRLERGTSILATTEKVQVGFHRHDDVLLGDFLRGLLEGDIRERKVDNPNPVSRPDALEPGEADDLLGIESFFRILGLHLRDNSVVVCDTGDSVLGAIGLCTSARRSFLADAYYLTMGFAVPAAIGAMVADPSRRAFVVVGDGAFQMTGMELSTAVKQEIPLTVLIINNRGYGTQRHILDGPFNEILDWRYTRIAQVLGRPSGFPVSGTHAVTKWGLHAALEEAGRGARGVRIIEVSIPRDSASPALKRMGAALGKLRSVKTEGGS